MTRIALITGGAGGIGRLICERLAISGYTPIVGYHRRKDEAAALAISLQSVAIQCVVNDSENLRFAAETILEQYGRLDLLVNNAGTTRFVPHDDLDGLNDQLFDEIMATNVRGAFACVRAFRTLLEAADAPVVVNMSSVAARTGIGSNVAYCASKAALDSMTRSLGRALAPKIRVLSIAPGPVDTDFIKGLDAKWREQQLARTPMGRFAAPEEVADAVLSAARFLTFATGSVIALDGGRPLT